MELRLKSTGVTANTLNPGGPVATEEHMAKNPGRKWVRAEVMVGPVCWLASDASDGVEGRRYIGTLWDASAPPSQAYKSASGSLGWSGFGEASLK